MADETTGIQGAGEKRKPKRPPREDRETTWKDALKVWGPLTLAAIIVLVWATRFIEPPPPRSLVMATGTAGGAYSAFGERYREVLARSGVKLELVPTAGSIDNLNRLMRGEADIGFVQGGTSQLVDGAQDALVSLGSLYSEALWLFYRAPEPIDRLSKLKGLRISVGPQASGTEAVARMLLSLNGVAPPGSDLRNLSSRDAAAALENGELDAAFLVASPKAQLVDELLRVPSIRLMNFRRHLAYARQIEYLNRADLPEGILDLEVNMPESDTILLAPTANLAAHEDIHPAVVQLLLEAAREIHGDGGILDEEGVFPNRWHLDLPLAAPAERYYRLGPTVLSRYLPYWAVSLVRSAIVLLIPLITIMIPVIKFAPAIYRWRVRVRIYRWYNVLQEIEEDTEGGKDLDLLDDSLARMVRLKDEVADVSVPYSYMNDVYELRVHIKLVREDLEERRARAAAG